MSAHITIAPGASRYSASMVQFIAQLQAVVDQVDTLKNVGDQIALGGDWDALAAKLGTTAAEAEAVYNLLGSVRTELNSPLIAQFLARLG